MASLRNNTRFRERNTISLLYDTRYSLDWQLPVGGALEPTEETANGRESLYHNTKASVWIKTNAMDPSQMCQHLRAHVKNDSEPVSPWTKHG